MVDPEKKVRITKNKVNKKFLIGVLVIIGIIAIATIALDKGGISKMMSSTSQIGEEADGPYDETEMVEMMLSMDYTASSYGFPSKGNGVEIIFEDIGRYNEISSEFVNPASERFNPTILVRNYGQWEVGVDDLEVRLYGFPESHFEGFDSLVKTNDAPLTQFGERIYSFADNSGVRLKQTLIEEGRTTFYDFGARIVVDSGQDLSVEKVCFISEKNEYDKRCRTPGRKEFSLDNGNLEILGINEQVIGDGRLSLVMVVKQVYPEQIFGKFGEEITERNEFAEIFPSEDWLCMSGGLLEKNLIKFSADGVARVECQLVEPLESGVSYTSNLNFKFKYRVETEVNQEVVFEKAQEIVE